MAEVRIPTILRTYTDGERAVPAAGATVAEVIDDLEANHAGIKERLLENAEVRRFVNIYVDDEEEGYRHWYGHVGGYWGTYSSRAEDGRGGGPGSGK